VLICDHGGAAAVADDLMALLVIFGDIVVTSVIALFAIPQGTHFLKCGRVIDITAVTAHHALNFRLIENVRSAGRTLE
jgi:hypothetical protein